MISMLVEFIVFTFCAVLAVVGLIVLYKILPYRNIGTKKPSFAILPKYKNQIAHSLTQHQLEKNLVELGFKKKGESGAKMKFSRGSLLKDFSVERAAVDICVYKISETKHEITLNAGWVGAFDTGDLWQLLTELSKKIETA